jgi:hypothetical protein
VRWLRDPVTAEGKISDQDWQMLEVTDDPERVVDLVSGRYGR